MDSGPGMNSVVMIVHDFPPEGNAGVYRPLRFVRQLQKMNWKTTVISAVPGQYERYDPELLKLVPRETEVIRVKGYDAWQALQAWRSRHKRNQNQNPDIPSDQEGTDQGTFPSWIRDAARNLEAWCYHPDMAAPWIERAVRATVSACSGEAVRVIWATAGPVTSFYVAQAASKQTGIPYVLDFRDSWTISYNEFESRRPDWAVRRDRKRMFELLQGSQAVVFRYATEAECYWRAYPMALDYRKVHIIPNGYEGAIEEFVEPDCKRCTILYTGTLTSYRFETLLDALRMLKDTASADACKLRLLFVGEGTEALRSVGDRLGLADLIETRGPVSYSEVARLQREAHAFLVLGRIPTMRGYELLVGAKLFEYLRMGRPIIGVLPSDETTSILRRLKSPIIADVESSEEIVGVLKRVLRAWSTHTLSTLVPDRKICEEFSVERQTVALTKALEGRPADHPFIRGAVDIPKSLQRYFDEERWSEGSARPGKKE